jgi:hypothetical protein
VESHHRRVSFTQLTAPLSKNKKALGLKAGWEVWEEALSISGRRTQERLTDRFPICNQLFKLAFTDTPTLPLACVGCNNNRILCQAKLWRGEICVASQVDYGVKWVCVKERPKADYQIKRG